MRSNTGALSLISNPRATDSRSPSGRALLGMLGFLFVSMLLLLPSSAPACTTFLMEGPEGPLVGKSYDWRTRDGMVLVNKAGVKKQALVLDPGKPASWTSKFASLTFNQYGAEMPNGGMNTAGLVIEIMWLNGSVTPTADERPAINELQWIQYHLDRFSTVAEVVESAKALRVSRIYAPVHYLVCDRSRSCAAIEYVDGQLVVSTGDQLPVPVLANHTYARSRSFLKRHAGFGGKSALPRTRGSLDRFVRAAALSKARAKQGVDGAFGVLDSVSQGDYSVWNIVYDLDQLTVHFRTSDHKHIKVVSLGEFDASCTSPRKMFPLQTAQKGPVTAAFVDYTDTANEALLERTLAPLRGTLPPGASVLLGRYPRTVSCTR